MTRRLAPILGGLFGVVLLVLFARCEVGGRRDSSSAPLFDRIVLVSIDTLRADHLGCYGYPRNTSPFLDELARRGILFDRAYASMATTVPSHASMFTSLYPLQHRILKNGQKLHGEFLTLSELLSAQGFATAAFVGTSMHFKVGNLDQGFETFDEPSLTRDAVYRPADETVDAALRWLETFDSGRRLFLFVHFFDVHPPWHPPAAHLRAFTSEESAEEKRSLLRFLTEEHHVPLSSFGRGTEGMLKTFSAYDAEIRFVDAELGRLLHSLGALGLRSRMLWIITSDHGEGLGNHGYASHGMHVYDEQVRVPLLFYSTEGALGPRRVSAIVEHVDLLPTVASLVGAADVSPGRPIQGRSLAPAVRGDSLGGDFRRAAFVQRRAYAPPGGPEADQPIWPDYEPGEKFALVERDWKYIHRTVGGDELYEIGSDPYETRNLATQRPDRAQEMKARLLGRVGRLRDASGLDAEPVDAETIERLRALGYVP